MVEKKQPQVTVRVSINLQKLLNDRNMSMRKLALETNIRVTTISEICRQKRENINFFHLEKIASYLGITDMNEILSFEEIDPEDFPDERN